MMDDDTKLGSNPGGENAVRFDEVMHRDMTHVGVVHGF